MDKVVHKGRWLGEGRAREGAGGKQENRHGGGPIHAAGSCGRPTQLEHGKNKEAEEEVGREGLGQSEESLRVCSFSPLELWWIRLVCKHCHHQD